MNYFAKNKIIGSILILLLVVNISAVITFFVHGKHAPEKGRNQVPNDVARTTEFLKKELDFSDEQVLAFTGMQKAFLDQNESYRNVIQEAKRKLYGSLRVDIDEPANKDELLEVIAENSVKIEMNTYRYFEQLKSLCSEEQLQMFDMLMGRILMTIDPGHRPPDPEGQGHRPPERETRGHRPPPPPEKRK